MGVRVRDSVTDHEFRRRTRERLLPDFFDVFYDRYDLGATVNR